MSDIVFDRMIFDHLEKVADQSNRIAALEEEIARLRLTAEEREAVERVSVAYELLPTVGAKQVSATLRKMLERLGG